jgi:hypothetical protein
MKSNYWRRLKEVERKRRFYTKAQKARCLDAVPFILDEIGGWNRRLGMVAQLRSERRA